MKIKSNKLPKKKYPSNLFAFGMIELSSVAFLIGILIAGIVTAQKLVYLSRLSTARVLTKSSPVHVTEDVIFWLEATSTDSFDEDERMDGASVSTWYDLNPHLTGKNNVTQGSSGNRPIYTENAISRLPALRFDGSNDYLEGDFIFTGDELTVFIVAKRSESVNEAAALTTYDSADTDDDSSDSFTFSEGATAVLLQAVRNDSSLSNHTHPGNDIPYIFTTRFDGTNNIGYFNGTAANAVSSSGNFDINKLLMGARYLVSIKSKFYNGDIGEIIIYDRALLSFEQDQIEEYLSEKWNITLD